MTSRLKTIIEFKQRFTLNPHQLSSLNRDIQRIKSLSIEARTQVVGGEKPTLLRIKVRADDQGKPPFTYFVSYENRRYNAESGNDLWSGAYVSQDLR